MIYIKKEKMLDTDCGPKIKMGENLQSRQVSPVLCDKCLRSSKRPLHASSLRALFTMMDYQDHSLIDKSKYNRSLPMGSEIRISAFSGSSTSSTLPLITYI